MRERLSTSCTKDLSGMIWSESLPEDKEVGVVDGEDVDVDIDGDIDVCDRTDEVDAKLGDDDCSLSKTSGCF